jgi:hypothetical protein
MKLFHTTTLATLFLLTATAVSQAVDPPMLPTPEKEHAWLQQLVGEWNTEVEMIPEPGQPAITSKGTESVRAIGPFWIQAESTMNVMDLKIIGLLTVGYDADGKKYVGTWIDSVSGYHWKYDGQVDKEGKKLTLNTEGPCPYAPGKNSKFKEVIEIKSKNEKVFTSSVQGDDGKWTTMLTITAKRKN